MVLGAVSVTSGAGLEGLAVVGPGGAGTEAGGSDGGCFDGGGAGSV